MDFHYGRETRKKDSKGHDMRRTAYTSSECNTTSEVAAGYGRHVFFPYERMRI